MANKRPINLNLFTIKFPITAIASILHRISGVILFLFIPIILYLFAISLHTPEGFLAVYSTFTHPLIKCLVLAGLFAFFYHACAGIRHLVMDGGWGESLAVARVSAGFVMGLSIVLTLLAGFYLW